MAEVSMTRNLIVAALVAVILAGFVLAYTYLAPPMGPPITGSTDGRAMQGMAPQAQATASVADQLQQIQGELTALRNELAELKGLRGRPIPMAPRMMGEQMGQTRLQQMPPIMGPCGQMMGMLGQMGGM
jgi:hypothetical protein